MRVKALAFGLAVAAIGLAIDFGMSRLFRDFWPAELVGNLLTGGIAGYILLRYMAYRHQLTQQRAARIAYLNHHIRNAMEAIVLSHYTVDDVRRLEMMRQASDRIHNALKHFTADDDVSLEIGTTCPGESTVDDAT